MLGPIASLTQPFRAGLRLAGQPYGPRIPFHLSGVSIAGGRLIQSMNVQQPLQSSRMREKIQELKLCPNKKQETSMPETYIIPESRFIHPGRPRPVAD